MAMAMVMGTTETATTATAMAMVMGTEAMIQQITKCWHRQKRERNERPAMQRGHATPKPFSVHLNARRGSPSTTRRRRDALSTAVASAKSLASVSILSNELFLSSLLLQLFITFIMNILTPYFVSLLQTSRAYLKARRFI